MGSVQSWGFYGAISGATFLPGKESNCAAQWRIVRATFIPQDSLFFIPHCLSSIFGTYIDARIKIISEQIFTTVFIQSLFFWIGITKWDFKSTTFSQSFFLAYIISIVNHGRSLIFQKRSINLFVVFISELYGSRSGCECVNNGNTYPRLV